MVWDNYRELDYERLIYTNTLAPLHAAELAAAIGEDPVVTAVLLTASNDTAYARLSGRECAPAVIRVDTNGRTSAEVAEHIRSLLPW